MPANSHDCFEPSTDFEVYCVPEEVCLSRFSLAGLGRQQWPLNVLEEDFAMIQPCLPLSPLKKPSGINLLILSELLCHICEDATKLSGFV